MTATRQNLVDAARRYLGARFGHQGRMPNVLDCGGLVLLAGRAIGVTTLEFLGYADFPNEGKFERLLDEHAVRDGFVSRYPHCFDGTEFLPADLMAFDYNNGEGIRHVAIVTRWDGRRYWIIDAQPNYGVSEHPLAHPFNLATLHRYKVRGLTD